METIVKKNRPVGVTLISILFILASLPMLFFSTTIIYGTNNNQTTQNIFIVYAVVLLLAGIGLWLGKRWGWILALIVSGMGIAVWFIFPGRSIFATVLGAVIFLYLILSKPVRAFFLSVEK